MATSERASKSALIIVDMQNDFVNPDGALYVPGSETLVDDIATFADTFDLVIATRDYHPENHSSFEHNGGEWPEHCVQGTPGAAIVYGLLASYHVLIEKGQAVDGDGYSAFEGTAPIAGGSLNDILVKHGVETVHIVGVALDYCVKATALDSVKLGYETILHTDATKSVFPSEQASTLASLLRSGVHLTNNAAA